MIALKIINEKGDPNDKNYVLSVAEIISFDDLGQEMLRSEEVGKIASQVAVISQVREVLLEFQRNFAAFPPDGKLGAVLDGRAIGTVVCPYATHKIFLSASVETRARRRFKELQKRGPKVIHSRVLREIKDRDTRDELRSVSPLVAAEGSLVLDTSDLSAREVFEVVRGFISGQDCSER